MLAKLNKEWHEIFYLETGKPDSSKKKILKDHRKLARNSKDSIDRVRSLQKSRKIFKITKDFQTIFTINVAGI